MGELKLPKCWLADLIHSQMATGNFAKMAKDAIDNAKAYKRHDDVTLYRNMLDQISDYYAQRGDGTTMIILAPPDGG